jgi:hypothetical protein
VTKSFASLPLCGFDCYDRFRIGYAEFKEPQSKSKQFATSHSTPAGHCNCHTALSFDAVQSLHLEYSRPHAEWRNRVPNPATETPRTIPKNSLSREITDEAMLADGLRPNCEKDCGPADGALPLPDGEFSGANVSQLITAQWLIGPGVDLPL